MGRYKKYFCLTLLRSGIFSVGKPTSSSHSGSRGLGHQVCQDALDIFIEKGYDKDLPDKQLVAAPFASKRGKTTFAAMAAATNFLLQ
jgi:tRNA-splicing ligase RtcB